MNIGTWVNIHIAGRKVPGIVTSKPETIVVETRQGKRIPNRFADVLTLRETNPANGPVVTYLRTTPENLSFATLRSTRVAGLDYDPETGAVLTMEELEDRRSNGIMARQAANLAASATVEIDLDTV
jgi:hypothetical protein